MPMKNFKKTCLQPVLLALCLITVCGSANAADNNVEEPTVVAIHAKYLHSLFLMSDGSLWGAGSNLTGALGGNGFVHPTPWIIINDVSAASAGKLHSLFLKKDGSVWAVGWVGSGALGDGFSVDLEKNPADLYGQKKGEGIQRITPVRVMEGEQPFLQDGGIAYFSSKTVLYGHLERMKTEDWGTAQRATNPVLCPSCKKWRPFPQALDTACF